jgi:hypothetical protein
MRILLTVEPLQNAIAELLLVKLADESLQAHKIDRLILSQFRWYVQQCLNEVNDVDTINT